MATLSLETRKTRLLAHVYDRLLEDAEVNYYEWVDVLDAIQDVLNDNTDGMKEWTITKNNELTFK